MKKWKFLCLLFASAVILCSCKSNSSPEAEITETEVSEDSVPLRLTMATVGSWKNVLRGNVFQKYCKELDEWSQGQMLMQLYDGGKLGDDNDLIAGVQLGTLCIINSCPAYQIKAVPEAAMLDAPGIFDSVEQYNTMMESGYFEVMQEYYNKAGLQLLGSFAYTFRQMSSNVPVYRIEDLKGICIRTMENKYHEAYWQALGATTFPLVFRELYMALDQGIMDAAENSLNYLEISSLGEVQDYVIYTYHAPMVSSYVMNKEKYDCLTDQQKEWLNSFMEGVKEDVSAQMPVEEEQLKERLITKYEMTLLYPDENMLRGLKSGRDEVIRLLREDLGDAVVDEFLSAVEDARIKTLP